MQSGETHVHLPTGDDRVHLASNDMAVVNASIVKGKLEYPVWHVHAGERAGNLPITPYWMHRFDVLKGVVISGGEVDYGDPP
jgi:hypothetical protein